MTPAEIASAVKQGVSMLQCATRYGFEPNRGGFIRCPFHQEKTPSMKCYSGTRGFSCYGCGERGSVIDFVQKLYGLDFRQAVIRLDADFGLCLPLGTRMTARERQTALAAKRKADAERANRQRAVDDAENEYALRLSWWLLLERFAALFAPKPGDEEWDELFAFAIRERTFAREELERAEMMRMVYARQRYCDT